MPNQGRAVGVCVGLETHIETQLTAAGLTADIRRIWHPKFKAEDLAATPIVTIRPSDKPNPSLRRRQSVIEIAITQRLPATDDASEDPYNQLDELDELDFLAEVIGDLFMVFDPDEKPRDTAGALSTVVIDGQMPVAVEYRVIIDAQSMDTNRQFLAVILVTYQVSD